MHMYAYGGGGGLPALGRLLRQTVRELGCLLTYRVGRPTGRRHYIASSVPGTVARSQTVAHVPCDYVA